MARTQARIGLVQGVLVLSLAAIVVRAAQVQLLKGGEYAEEAASSRTEVRLLEARRGTLFDRSGLALAVTQESYRVGIAPNEVTDRAELVRTASRQLGVSAAALKRDLAGRKPYIYFYGPFTATEVAPLRAFNGVHIEGVFLRNYPSRRLAGRVIGRMTPEGAAASGLELALDGVVTGVPGEEVVLKDRRGRRYESPGRLRKDPVPGNDVVLTLDAELQDIAEQSLREAVLQFDAQGGDIVVLDPRTGELLAVASQKDGQPELLAFTEPFEPGSTAKLFTAAALLAHERVDSTDRVSNEGGEWEMPLANGTTRRIRDEHAKPGMLTLADAIEVSSNVAMAKFSDRLTPTEQYSQLRDFGFGSPTGIELPSESRGLVYRPERWTPELSRVSTAMGYEFEVTALQLAAAYAAIANDGVLLTPTLVREVRAPDGEVLYRHQPEPVRRAVSPETAARLREFLRGASSRGGTGSRAQVGGYGVLGKTGTARRVRNGRYVDEYVASFASMFPADDPQLVVVVKIDGPSIGGYYGGDVAAPVVRSMLEQALASRRVSFDRSRLPGGAAPRAADAPPASTRPEAGRRIVVPVPAAPDPPEPEAVTIPLVTGLSVRAAAVALHHRGLAVSISGVGTVRASSPAAGVSAPAGTVVHLQAE
ncbi:MAG TPA: penicillin-binding transpeptidase domain-containing protein [Gemmatimonadales bacterium]|nr:penicillin-binding transpeptidase domain-containing protein [Gemmatimonadales bacterium]